MATKHIFSKAITTGILGGLFLPIASDVEASFIGDTLTLTLNIAGNCYHRPKMNPSSGENLTHLTGD
jgi:hypothetical protein